MLAPPNISPEIAVEAVIASTNRTSTGASKEPANTRIAESRVAIPKAR